MLNLLLFLILVTQISQIFLLKKLIDLNDFTKEDVSVKANTEHITESTKEVEQAIDKLPKPQTKKGK